MLWKKQLSVYTNGSVSKHTIQRKENSKLKSGLTPLVPVDSISMIRNTLETPAPRFLIRKKSKSTKMVKEKMPNTFFLHRGNNFQLVKAVLESMGCVETVSKEAASLVWYQGKDMARKDLSRKDMSSKMVNYFPNHGEITNKQNLYENMARFKPDCVGDFLPKTFVVDFRAGLEKVEASLFDFVLEYFRKTGIPRPKKHQSLVISNYHGEICVLFSRVFKQLGEQRQGDRTGQRVAPHHEPLWIVKPSFMNRGQGIEIMSSLRQLEKILSEDSQQISIRMYEPDESSSPTSYVIQEYIMDPLLYRGYKFDVRVWILLRKSKNQGLQVFLYRKGHGRLATQKYHLGTTRSQPKEEHRNSHLGPCEGFEKLRKSKRQANIIDPFIHLTNNAVQKNSRSYGEVHEGNQISLEDLIEDIQQPQLSREFLFQEFRKIIGVMINSCKEKLGAKTPYGTFQLMGLDFMIDSLFKVWLIEANCNPSLEESSALLKSLLPEMLAQLFQVINISRVMGMPRPAEEANQMAHNLWEQIIY